MKTRFLSLLILVCLALGGLCLAEDIEAAQVEEAVEEVSLELGAYETPVELDDYRVLAPEDTEDDVPCETAKPTAEPAVGSTVEPTVEPAPDGPAYFTQPLKTLKIKLLKASSTKTVYQYLNYKITVPGEKVKSFYSADRKIAKVARDGTLTIKEAGTVNITVKTKSAKTYHLTLKIVHDPIPRHLTLTVTKNHMKLSWTAARYATGYLVEYSHDGENWYEYTATNANKLSKEITKVVSGTTLFRVRAIIGDHLSGASYTVSVLRPVTDVKVILGQTYTYGPTDRVNVTWSPSQGAWEYAVYRTSLPSNDYELIGTTRNTWYPDVLAPTKLYAYRIRPVWNDQYDAPLSDPVNLYSGWQSNVLPPSDMTSSSGGIIVVNKKAQVVTVYIRDENGNYTLPLRHMICSTGLTYERTRNGVYTIQRKIGEWYTYPGPSGDTIHWPSVYRSGYYFHSPLFNRDHTIRYSTVRRLGQRASAGCIRLPNNDAEWVYKHAPIGTTVYICDGAARSELHDALMPKTVNVQGF